MQICNFQKHSLQEYPKKVWCEGLGLSISPSCSLCQQSPWPNFGEKHGGRVLSCAFERVDTVVLGWQDYTVSQWAEIFDLWIQAHYSYVTVRTNISASVTHYSYVTVRTNISASVTQLRKTTERSHQRARCCASLLHRNLRDSDKTCDRTSRHLRHWFITCGLR